MNTMNTNAYRFHNATDYSPYRKHEGKRMTIIRFLTEDEADTWAGLLLSARMEDGEFISVFVADCVPVWRDA